MSIRIETITGAAVRPLLPALSALRAVVFRDWPYLYEASPASEQLYLQDYVDSPRAAIIVAFNGEQPIGASTCQPMAEAAEEVREPFLERGWELGRFCYFGESVLLPAWRGQGIGVAFFTQREAQARRGGFDFATFCAVQRPPDHPSRPPDHVPLDAFWGKRGFVPRSDLVCRMSWRDVGEPGETTKPLAFWLKPLTGHALP